MRLFKEYLWLRLVVYFFLMLVFVTTITMIMTSMIRSNYEAENEKKIELFADFIAQRFVDYERINDEIERLYEHVLIEAKTYVFENFDDVDDAFLKDLTEQNDMLSYALWIDSDGNLAYASHELEDVLPSYISKDHPLHAFFHSEETELIEGVRASEYDGRFYKLGNFKNQEGAMLQLAILADAEDSILSLLTIQSLIDQIAQDENVVYARFIDRNYIIQAHSDMSFIGERTQDDYIEESFLTFTPFTIRHHHDLEDTKAYCVGHPIKVQEEMIGLLNIGYDVTYMSVVTREVTAMILTIGIIIYLLMAGSGIYAYKMRKANFEGLRTDALTKLQSRTYLDMTLKALAKKKKLNQYSYILLNINKFNLLNSLYGLDTGDEILRQVSTKLKVFFPETSLYRLDADDFLIIKAIQSKEALHQEISKIFEQLEGNYYIDNLDLDISLSIAVHNKVHASYSTAKVLSDLKATMKESKTSNQSGYQLFNENIITSIKRKEAIEQALKSVLIDKDDTHQLRVVFQPQYKLDETNTLAGLEALSRLTMKTLGEISPLEFIPIAEESGLINELGKFVLSEACTLHQQMSRASNKRYLTISINASNYELSKEDFAKYIIKTIKTQAIEPHAMIIEITESVLSENPEILDNTLKTLKEANIRLAIDDFGMGYSSLSYLAHANIDFIKIDRSFISKITSNQRSKVLVETILTMSKKLNFTTIAEGVETKEELNILKTMKCDYAQGFYFNKALEKENVISLLNRHIAKE